MTSCKWSSLGTHKRFSYGRVRGFRFVSVLFRWCFRWCSSAEIIPGIYIIQTPNGSRTGTKTKTRTRFISRITFTFNNLQLPLLPARPFFPCTPRLPNPTSGNSPPSRSSQSAPSSSRPHPTTFLPVASSSSALGKILDRKGALPQCPSRGHGRHSPLCAYRPRGLCQAGETGCGGWRQDRRRECRCKCGVGIGGSPG